MLMVGLSVWLISRQLSIRNWKMSKEKPELEEIYKEQDHLTRVADFPNRDPENLFRFWIDPTLISKWWPPVAQIEAKLGGAYVLNWPKQNWFLRGTFTQFDPGKVLVFTWKWDHEPEKVNTEVRVNFEPLGSGGTHLTLTHGNYSKNDTEQRQSHLEGWMFFLGKLQSI